MDAITYLTGLSLILILGILGSFLARKMRVSPLLILVLLGMLLANSGLAAFSIFSLPNQFIVGLSLLTLAMVVFDGSSKLTLQDLEKRTDKALELVTVFIVCNLILLGEAASFLVFGWSVQGVIYSIILAVVMAGTDPGSVFIMLGDVKHKALDFLRLEAILNTPIIVIIPFLLINILRDVSVLSVASTLTDLLVPFLQQIFVGVGTGVVIGIIVFRMMRKHYSKQLSPIVVIATTILSYVLAENFGGNGVLSVATLGLVFGNTYVKRREYLMEFSGLLATSLEILVFILVGMLVVVDFPFAFFLKSILLFLVAIAARHLAVLITLHDSDFKLAEKTFIALNMPKGIAVAVVALTFSVLGVNLDGVLPLMILFIVYSLILSSVTDRFGKFFIRKEILLDEAPPATKK